VATSNRRKRARPPQTRAIGPQTSEKFRLNEVVLAEHEREQVDSNLRLHDALNDEIALVERQLAQQALASADVRRLMTIPGVGAITALALLAVIGDVTRFPSPRHLVGYLGLDPRVRQSGAKKARHGHISREGQAHARGLLVEAAHTAIRTPGPLRAFHARLAPRRGKQVALCATARKLTVLVWHLLTKQQDYRFSASTITQRKLRKLQRTAGDTGPRISVAGETKRKALEQRFLEEAERNYQNYVAFKARPGSRGAGAASGDTTPVAVKAADDARQAPQSPDACSSRSGSPAPQRIPASSP
jgi:transposase